MLWKEFQPSERGVWGSPLRRQVGVEQAVGWAGCGVDGAPPCPCWDGLSAERVLPWRALRLSSPTDVHLNTLYMRLGKTPLGEGTVTAWLMLRRPAGPGQALPCFSTPGKDSVQSWEVFEAWGLPCEMTSPGAMHISGAKMLQFSRVGWLIHEPRHALSWALCLEQ